MEIKRILLLIVFFVVSVLGCTDHCPTSNASPDVNPDVFRAKKLSPVAAVEKSGPDTDKTTASSAKKVSTFAFSTPSPTQRSTARVLAEGRLIAARPVSRRSWSLKVRLQNGSTAVFKPFRRGNHAARFEVAYYRLATALGVGVVLVAVLRSIPAGVLKKLLAGRPDDLAAFNKTVDIDDRGRIVGAMIAWLDHLAPARLEEPDTNAGLRALFGQRPLSPRARHLGDGILLDAVLGNWDRFSGGNLFFVEGSDQVALLDHNGSFYRLSRRQNDRVLGYLKHPPCFSARLLNGLRYLTVDNAKPLLDTPLLDGELVRPDELERVMARRDEQLPGLKACAP